VIVDRTIPERAAFGATLDVIDDPGVGDTPG
jgi:hypothetical protein